MVTIGVDVGTSGVKMLAMDITGAVLKIVSREYPLYMDGSTGWAEQEPNDWWAQTADGLRELTGEVAAMGKKVEALSFSGQMHGLVVLDENDNVIRRAILWNDQRTQAQCDYLNNTIGRDKLLEHTGNIALTGFTLPKILWMKDNEPELFAKIRKIMLPKDYIAYKLSGVFATDETDASGTLLLDVHRRAWSPIMVELAGLKPGQLPKVFASNAVVGTVTKRAAEETRLNTQVKVVIGGGDQAVGAVGTGTVVGGMCSLSLGTSGVVFVACDNYAVDKSTSGVHSFCHANGRYHMMGVTLGASASNTWWTEEIIGTRDYAKEQAPISHSDLGKNSVFYLPYLSGERTPINDPYARGAFVGMTTSTGRAEMMLAVLEGVSYSLRDNLEAIRALGVVPCSARIIGGGAKSPLWCQITADILGLRVDKINSEEGPAFGAAILAAVGAGAFATVEEACNKLIAVTETYQPNAESVKRYSLRYPIYRGLYIALADTFAKMQQV